MNENLAHAATVTLEAARDLNLTRHGSVEEARESAADTGDGFCEDCYAVFHLIPGEPNDGHACLAA